MPTCIRAHRMCTPCLSISSGVGLGAWSGITWRFSPISARIQVGGSAGSGVEVISSGRAEAANILAALLTYAPLNHEGHIELWTDSNNVVDGWAAQTSKSRGMLLYLRAFAHIACVHSLSLSISHIQGTSNQMADHISRGQVDLFFQQEPVQELGPQA